MVTSRSKTSGGPRPCFEAKPRGAVLGRIADAVNDTKRGAWGFCLGLFASKDARDAANDAAHGQFAFCVGEEDFAGAGAAVEPALQDGEMLHRFQRGFWLFRREMIAELLARAIPSTATLRVLRAGC